MRRIARKLLKLNDLYPPQNFVAADRALRRLALQSDAIQRLSNAPRMDASAGARARTDVR
jgi:hypothetical protein